MAGNAPIVGPKRHDHELPGVATTMKDDRSFHLSRIYAKGWNAAKALSSDYLAELDAKSIAAMNPYRIEDERRRWKEGFAAAAIR